MGTNEGSTPKEGTNDGTPPTEGGVEAPAERVSTPPRISDEHLKEIVQSAWVDQATWSRTAGRLKERLSQARAAAGFGGVLGAMLETVAAAIPDDPASRPLRGGLALAGAAILAVTAVVQNRRASQEQVHAWIRARSVSEALKEEIFRFLVGATPYIREKDVALFEENLEKRKAEDEALNREVASMTTPEVRDRPTTPITVDDYISQRVEAQIKTYYLDKAKKNADRGNLLRAVEFSLAMVAAALGVVAASDVINVPALGSGVAILTTAGAAVAANLAAGRYDAQAISFYGTASRLRALRNSFYATARTPESISAFVDKCEQAISSENEAWLATWGKMPDGKSADA